MKINLTRRQFVGGVSVAVAMPSVIRAQSASVTVSALDSQRAERRFSDRDRRVLRERRAQCDVEQGKGSATRANRQQRRAVWLSDGASATASGA